MANALIKLVPGIIITWCAAKNYDWFMESTRMHIILGMVGRAGLRVIYIIIGVILIILGIAGLISILQSA
jgi:hypothetical protein